MKATDPRVTRDVIVIGASAGGIEAVTQLLGWLPADLPAVVGIVIHRGVGGDDWSRSLARRTKLTVREANQGEPLLHGVAYVAPGDVHMMFDRCAIRLDCSDKQHFTRPAIDPLFTSAASAFGSRVIGIALSGAGSDGSCGLVSVVAAGGVALAQSPGEALFASLPLSAIRRNPAASVLVLDDMGRTLNRLVSRESYSAA